MKILHVTRDFPPRVNGGISVAVGGLVAAQGAAGLTTHVVSFDAWRPRGGPRAAPLPAADGVTRARSGADLEAARGVARDFAPDVVHVHHAMLFDALGLEAARVLTLHVDQARQRRLRGLEAPTRSELAQRDALEVADAVIAPSRASAIEGAHVIPFGVSLPEELATGDDVLYVGRLADIKGTAELFEAAHRLPEVQLTVAGGLPDRSSSERRWRARAPGNVRFVGWLERDALACQYRRAAVLVAPSWHETFGLAVAEAMSFGVPVIASDAGALRERVTHEVSGLVVPPRDPGALASAVRRLRADEALRRRLARGARRAAEAWTWAACAERNVRVYEAVLSRRARGRERGPLINPLVGPPRAR